MTSKPEQVDPWEQGEGRLGWGEGIGHRLYKIAYLHRAMQRALDRSLQVMIDRGPPTTFAERMAWRLKLHVVALDRAHRKRCNKRKRRRRQRAGRSR